MIGPTPSVAGKTNKANGIAQSNTESESPIETHFAVPGIHCVGCIGKLERSLPLNPAISAARVNFTTKSVGVRHTATTEAPDLVEAFAALGFEAWPLDSASLGTSLGASPSASLDERLGEAASENSRDLLKAMAVAGFAMMNIMLLSVSVWSGASGTTRDMFHWLSALIALPALVFSARPFFRSAWRALRCRQTNMDVPIAIGILLTVSISLFETATHGPHAYFDGVVMLVFVLLVGRWLDSIMRDRARGGIISLRKTMGTGAFVLDQRGASQWTPAKALRPGMEMLVAAGERLAADGIVTNVTKGAVRLDVSMLTGENAPIVVGVGDSVLAGSLNLAAPVEVRVKAVSDDTVLADIARLMAEAAQSKSRYVRIAERAARLYAPFVHTLAVLAFAGWMVAGVGWHQSLLIAVAVLIITCPCALGLAVPAAHIVVAGALMRIGVLVKDGSAIERLAEVDTALFDKTGTLTLGRCDPVNMAAANLEQKMLLLALAQSSRHPLSQALHRALQAEAITPAVLENRSETVGFGVSASYRGTDVALGRLGSGASNSGPSNSGASDSGASNSGPSDSGASNSGASNSGASNSGPSDSGASNSGASNSGASNSGPSDSGASNSGASDSHLAAQLTVAGQVPLVIYFADRLRPGASATLAALEQMRIKARIVSGDRAEAVNPIAHQLSLPAHSAMLPRDKLALITRLSESGHKCLMLGDGLNDGPALAAGHASIAPGSASDVGKNAADLIFLGDSLLPVAAALRAARRTQTIVKQNFMLAIGYNMIAVPLALAGYVTPMIAAIAMSGSSIIVVANAMRLRKLGQ